MGFQSKASGGLVRSGTQATGRDRTISWYIWIVLAAISPLLIAMLGSGCSGKDSDKATQGPTSRPAVPVSVARVAVKNVPVELATFGTVDSYNTVSVKSQVNGLIVKVHFTRGQNVKKDAELFTIDTQPFETALAQAQANLDRDKALAENAQKEAKRQADLYAKHVASSSDYDTSIASAKVAEAVVLADEALVKNAKLQLSYCHIMSPIDGRVGYLTTDEGNLVKANDVPLAVINQVRPVNVFFSIPQEQLSLVRRYHAEKPLAMRTLIPGEEDKPETGELTFIDNTVDNTTGTIRLGGTFPNLQERLWPGQYVKVVLILTVRKDAVVVPTRAVQTGRSAKYVFVVKEDQTVEIRPVTILSELEGESVVEKGLSAGETVVVDGQLLLLKGSKVQIKDDGGKGPQSATQAQSAPAGDAMPTTNAAEGSRS